MAKVEIYTKDWCPYCARAKADLEGQGLAFEEIDVTSDAAGERAMVQRSSRHTVPQIFIDDHHLGGSDDLRAAIASGQLEPLLSESSRDEAA